MDNQEYNFADESNEIVSVIPTDIVLDDAVPEPIISLKLKGNSEQATTPSPENPQPINSTSDSKIELGIHSTNLLDINDAFPINVNANTISINGNDITTTLIRANEPEFAFRIITDNIDFFNTYGTIQFKIKNTSNIESFYIEERIVDSSNNIVQYVSAKRIEPFELGKLYSFTSKKKSLEHKEGYKFFLTFIGYLEDITKLASFTISDLMLERGSTATEYQPYFRNAVEIPVSSGIVLRRIGDYSDELVIENGTVKNIQRIAELTKQDTLQEASSKEYTYFTTSTETLLAYDNQVLCASNMLKGVDFVNGLNPGLYNRIAIDSSQGIYLRFSQNTTLEEAIAYYQNPEFKIYGVLATPIETDITSTAIGQQLLQLSTERGLNTMHVIADVNPSEIKTKYWRQKR